MSDSNPSRRCVLISADHGLALVYFLQTDVVPILLEAGVRVVVLTDEAVLEKTRKRFGRPGLTFDSLRLGEARAFEKSFKPELQWWLHFLRRVAGSNRINTEAMDSYIEQVAVEQSNWRRIWMPLAWLAIAVLRRSRRARRLLVRWQQSIRPNHYGDLLNEHQPDLVIGSTPGWRLDRYLLREASAASIPVATAIIGWDNPSSYSIPGAEVTYASCWSEIQAQELENGSDWLAENVHVGGIPTYDGYFNERWQASRQEYFDQHGLDPQRKLIAYACSFVSFAPNWPNVEALADLVTGDQLAEPCQLLVRLHPNHFLDVELFQQERTRIQELAERSPKIVCVDPVPLGGSLGHYSGEDMEEKASMLAHADVFVTVYSTMVVEAAVHDRPIVSLCLDRPGGWDWPRKYSLPLSQIGEWPTHKRFRDAGAGKVALTIAQAKEFINRYLEDPSADSKARRSFVEQEITFTDGSAGRRSAQFFLSLLPRVAGG